MKYCPYCGAELFGSEVPFCAECGKHISQSDAAPQENKKKKKFRFGMSAKKKKGREIKKKTDEEPDTAPEEPEETVNDDYDGYYDDIMPFEEAAERQVIDKEIIKKIALIVTGVIGVIILCVVALNFM